MGQNAHLFLALLIRSFTHHSLLAHRVSRQWLIQFLRYLAYKVKMKFSKGLSKTSFKPKGLTGRIYVGDHLTVLFTEYISCGPDGFREDKILSFSHYKSV